MRRCSAFCDRRTCLESATPVIDRRYRRSLSHKLFRAAPAGLKPGSTPLAPLSPPPLPRRQKGAGEAGHHSPLPLLAERVAPGLVRGSVSHRGFVGTSHGVKAPRRSAKPAPPWPLPSAAADTGRGGAETGIESLPNSYLLILKDIVGSFVHPHKPHRLPRPRTTTVPPPTTCKLAPRWSAGPIR
jgi:hypothetical protein